MLTYIVNWTLRNSEIYFTLLFLTLLLFVYYGEEILNWIELELKENELNWNWIERFWIRFEFELNWIEKSWIQLELELTWIERNELIRALVKVTTKFDHLKSNQVINRSKPSILPKMKEIQQVVLKF